MKREAAWRVFAGEYNDASVEIKGTGEKTPSYVVTPLGSKINRVFIVGVLTDVENASENGEFLRAHVSDPTGVFTLYSGQFQPEATDQLVHIDVPAFVAVVAKARTYEPEEGTLFVSLRPELVREVSADIRDRWILETCMQTKQRIEAFMEATKMNQPNAYDLRKLGFSRELSDGIVAAIKGYGHVDTNKYASMILESLHYIQPDKQASLTSPDKEQLSTSTEEEEKKEKKAGKKKKQEETKAAAIDEESETTVLESIKELEGDDGAAWDLIVENCVKKGLNENTIEEALTSLMDKGFVFEPVLGTIKTT
jgi:hypothetical protein